MGTFRLRKAERELFASVEHGDRQHFFKKERIRAEVLRHIVLGLPLRRTGIGLTGKEVACAVTGAGVALEGATVEGRLRLDAAIGGHGGPINPLQFLGCTFEGGIAASHAHLSRLSLRDCAFAPSRAEQESDKRPQPPSVDLSGAKLDGDLDMGGVEAVDPKAGAFWIKAPGLEVNGDVSLNGCTIRSPEPGQDWPDAENPEDALDLTLARIAGDLVLTNGSVFGGLKLRSGRIGGNAWFDGATIQAGVDDALFMQGTLIGGFLMMTAAGDGRSFTCTGRLNLTAVEVGLGLQLTGKDVEVDGWLTAPDLAVALDCYLGARLGPVVDLRDVRIGGTLDISRARVAADPVAAESGEEASILCLRGAKIGRSLEVACKPTQEEEAGASLAAWDDPWARPGFRMSGRVDLTSASCDTLDDDIGRAWGSDVRVDMNHFVYRQTGLPMEGGERRKSHEVVGDWLLAKRAEGARPWCWWPESERLKDDDFWKPWQLRRNWIYRQFHAPSDRSPADLRAVMDEEDYRPQPIEQAIRVARAEGREDFAIKFEMLRQRIEWGIFNRKVRWALGIVAILLSPIWLVTHDSSGRSIGITALAAAGTLGLMIYGSSIRRWVRKRIVTPLLRRRGSPAYVEAPLVLLLVLALLVGPDSVLAWPARIVPGLLAMLWLLLLGTAIAVAARRRHRRCMDVVWVSKQGSKAITWICYWLPAAALFFIVGWDQRPFHFFVAFVIFAAIRLVSVGAHFIMRFGFGYMRQPVHAITTLILAFLAGWAGTDLANMRNMFVVNAEPTAPVAGPEPHAAYPDGYGISGPVVLPGSRPVATADGAVRELSCAATMSEPLFALDALVPIVDLGEERRCEIRRLAEYIEVEGSEPRPRLNLVKPGDLKAGELRDAFPDLPLNDHRFWWWMKAIYAIFGWILVSLAILTFAQVNKIHAEPPHEHK